MKEEEGERPSRDTCARLGPEKQEGQTFKAAPSSPRLLTSGFPRALMPVKEGSLSALPQQVLAPKHVHTQQTFHTVLGLPSLGP